MLHRLALSAIWGLALFVITSCGAWITKYDQNAHTRFYANIENASVDHISASLRELSRSHRLQYVFQDKSSHETGGFNVIMRNSKIRVHATNFPNTKSMEVRFFKTKTERLRPSDDEVEQIKNDFISKLGSVSNILIETE